MEWANRLQTANGILKHLTLIQMQFKFGRFDPPLKLMNDDDMPYPCSLSLQSLEM